jgi:hypothetical protein
MLSDDDDTTENTTSSEPAKGPTKTIEEWALAKGLLPETVTTPARLGAREVLAPRQNPKFVQFTMAKAHRQWPQGKEVTEAEFDQAVADAGQVGIQ